MSVSVPVIDFIDPMERLVHLLPGVSEYHPVTDIYHEVRNLRSTDEGLRPFPVFVTAGGNVPKNVAGTKRTPRYAIFNNCKLVLSGDTLVAGEQLFADAAGDLVGSGPDCINKPLSPADAYVDYTPPDAEVIVVSGGSGLDAAQDAKLSGTFNNTNTIVGQVTGIEGLWGLRECVRLMLSSVMGKLSGAKTDGTPHTLTFRDIHDTKDRATVEVDGKGNRESGTYDQT